MQVYLILDEFILGGEFEETSKKVSTGNSIATRLDLLPTSTCEVLHSQHVLAVNDRLKLSHISHHGVRLHSVDGHVQATMHIVCRRNGGLHAGRAFECHCACCSTMAMP